MIGQTISHYKVIEKLGEGGMGIVYKAQDTKLDRIVALKFLPPHLSASEADKARFIQEAKAASALNHPNVCTIHDIQEHDSQMFIVMEFVDGQTLRERRGSVSLKQAIEIGTQIADGLAAAHEKGIVHRDIKPENIMIRKDGIAQIMDFGLAKLRGVSRLTKEGSTVGTAGYMSPEQVQGQDADHRSDIFSFGVVLYELITGQLPFKGVHDTALAYEIVNVDPAPMSSVKPEIDPALDSVVLECLEKDPNERTQSVKQISIDLKRVRRESGRQRASRITAAQPVTRGNYGPSGVQPAAPSQKPAAAQLWKWAAAFFLMTTLGSILYFSVVSTPQGQQTIRALIPLPEKSVLSNILGGGHLALSPEGEKIAFVASDSAGKSNLWVRAVNGLSAQMLAGTDNALFPFWSPDGKAIAFFADGKLKKIDAAGGTPFTICDAPDPRGGSWGQAGFIVFDSENGVGGISQVAAAGGTPSRITKLDSTRNEQTHRWPWFLPDGKHFLFFSRTTAAGSGSDADSVCAGSIESQEIKRLFHGISDAAYVRGHLLFMRESALMAQPFDLKNLQATGEPVPIAQQIQYDPRFSKASFSVSQNGLLLYQSTGTRWARELALFDPAGKKIRSFGQPEIYRFARLSPNEKRIAMEVVDIQSHNVDIWLHDIATAVETRFTFDPGADTDPLWSPDGNRIVFSSNRKSHEDIYMKATTGSAPEDLLTDFGARDKTPVDWSMDGRYILFAMQDPKTKRDLWILPMTGDRKPVPFVQTTFSESYGAFSPDMRWIAYISDESGKDEIYVSPFVPPGSDQGSAVLGKWQISMNGGGGLRWRGDGKAIFYPSDNKIMMAEVGASGSTFEVHKVTQYADLKLIQENFIKDLSSDGKRILGQINPPQEKSIPLTLVVNWDEELKTK